MHQKEVNMILASTIRSAVATTPTATTTTTLAVTYKDQCVSNGKPFLLKGYSFGFCLKGQPVFSEKDAEMRQ